MREVILFGSYARGARGDYIEDLETAHENLSAERFELEVEQCNVEPSNYDSYKKL